MTRIRPGWDEYFMRIAEAISARATCNRAQVGVVVVNDEHRILAGGYNGAPAGEPHCPPDESLVREDHCPRAVHAEQNAVEHAARFGVDLTGCTWYLWPFGPCPDCAELVASTHPARQVYEVDFELRSIYAPRT